MYIHREREIERCMRISIKLKNIRAVARSCMPNQTQELSIVSRLIQSSYICK